MFKIGDKVKRTTETFKSCIFGNIYTVKYIKESRIFLKEIEDDSVGYVLEFFTLVKPKQQKHLPSFMLNKGDL